MSFNFRELFITASTFFFFLNGTVAFGTCTKGLGDYFHNKSGFIDITTTCQIALVIDGKGVCITKEELGRLKKSQPFSFDDLLEIFETKIDKKTAAITIFQIPGIPIRLSKKKTCDLPDETLSPPYKDGSCFDFKADNKKLPDINYLRNFFIGKAATDCKNTLDKLIQRHHSTTGISNPVISAPSNTGAGDI